MTIDELTEKVFVVAELSANHNQNFDLAVKTLEAIKSAEADAVKLQTYTPDSITINCNNKYFKITGDSLWTGKVLYELYKEAYTPWEWHEKLKNIAEKLGLMFFSTPFDFKSVDFLEQLDVSLYKIASFEITDIPLIKYIASKGKPIILSTGIAELDDIELAVATIREQGNNEIALLKCTSAYPAPVEEANLLTIPDMEKRFDCVVGLSDHTLTTSVPVAAVALGARIIEKHFILDRSLGGPDAGFSMEPDEFKRMVKEIRQVEAAVGKVNYDISESVKRSKIFKRSLFVVKDIKKGEIFTKNNVRSIRPGYGLHPKYYDDIIGKKACCDINEGTPLSWEVVSDIEV